MADVRTIRVLDRGYIDGKLTLLDGKGNTLPPNTEAVFLTFSRGEIQKNSMGVRFHPPVFWDEVDSPGAPYSTDYA